ncbi:MAG: 50S ribosomal protein L30 [Acidobacteria bacterium RBG_16_64_8]|nr:MAG: 50S ribosomal protein L30 [Acidobacteria bacterium RBG_16_64_8]
MKKTPKIKIRQVRSAISTVPAHREILRGLGLRRIRHIVERPDTPAVRGMVARVLHLVEVIEG